MKIVEWTFDTAPDILYVDGDLVVFEDSVMWDGLEVGDQIHALQEPGEGVKCYFVVDVEAPNENLYPRGIVLVTIRGAIS